MKISSADIRRHAISACESGAGTQAQIAGMYGVDISTLQRWLQRYRSSGGVAPLARGHNPPALSEAQMQELDRLVQQLPDATLKQLRAALEVECSEVAIHNALKRLGYRYKKNASGKRARSR